VHRIFVSLSPVLRMLPNTTLIVEKQIAYALKALAEVVVRSTSASTNHHAFMITLFASSRLAHLRLRISTTLIYGRKINIPQDVLV
jgi:hypothetical protein